MLNKLIGLATGAVDEFNRILDNWHVPRYNQNGGQIGLQQRAMMLLQAIETLAPTLKAQLKNYWREYQ